MKNAELLLARDLENILQDLDKWAAKNSVADDRELSRNLDRIHNVADTLKMLHTQK